MPANPIPEKNLFAYSSHFSQNRQAKFLYQSKKNVATSLIATMFLGGLTAFFTAIGFYPQAVGLATCTFMGGVSTIGSRFLCRRRMRVIKRQNEVLQRLTAIEKNLTDPKILASVATIKHIVAVRPLSFAYAKDHQRLHDALIEATPIFANDKKQSREWRKVLHLLHGFSFYRADGRAVKLNLTTEKAILRKKTPFAASFKIELLTKTPRKDLKALQAFFRDQVEVPDFARKRGALRRKLKDQSAKVFVARDQTTKKIIGMSWLESKKEVASLTYCGRLAEQPSVRGIEKALVHEALSLKDKRLKVCLFKADKSLQEVFVQEGFLYAGVKKGLYGSFEDGKIKMERVDK
ncbi:MAG: hypothetical protein CK425_09600 [Parachlamydia sp.]|nr:MAG: hypothetical protein CK425_09600 [Parachlamydia sp.]